MGTYMGRLPTRGGDPPLSRILSACLIAGVRIGLGDDAGTNVRSVGASSHGLPGFQSNGGCGCRLIKGIDGNHDNRSARGVERAESRVAERVIRIQVQITGGPVRGNSIQATSRDRVAPPSASTIRLALSG